MRPPTRPHPVVQPASPRWRLLDAGLSLRTALLASYVGVFTLPLMVLLLGGALSHELLYEREEELSRTTTLVARLLETALCTPGAAPCAVDWTSDEVIALLHEVQVSTGAGARILDERGVIIATTGPNQGTDVSDRPEVRAALAGGRGTAGRTQRVPSVDPDRLGSDRVVTWAVATAPLPLDAQRTGVLLLTRPTREVSDAVTTMARGVGKLGLTALALAVAGFVFIPWRLSRSLRGLAAVTRHLEAEPHAELEVLSRSRVLEVRELAVAFAAVTDRLRARVAYNRDLAANVAHEFKTPLTTLRGIVELLDDAENPLSPEEVRSFLGDARTDLDRLSRMVSGLLDLARAESRADAPERTDTDLDAVLADSGCAVTGHVGRARGDAEGWATVVRNLVANARTHGADPVRIEAHEGGFDVIDGGAGISPANLPRVFDRFFTTGNDRQGTGLGLAIVRATVQAFGGTVRVHSRPGETRFEVRVAR